MPQVFSVRFTRLARDTLWLYM